MTIDDFITILIKFSTVILILIHQNSITFLFVKDNDSSNEKTNP